MKPSILILLLLLGSFALAQNEAPEKTATKGDMVAKLTAGDIAQGSRLFIGHCAYCHAMGGTGDRGLLGEAGAAHHGAPMAAAGDDVAGLVDRLEVEGEAPPVV